MRKSFIYNPLVRLFIPPVFGFWAYTIILLIFDSIGQLLENFNLVEVIVSILIGFLVFEGNRYSISLSNRFLKSTSSHFNRITTQLTIGIAITVLLVTITIIPYYTFLVGFKTYGQYLIIFNLIFILGCLLLHSAYFSIYFLEQINAEKIILEKEEKKHTEYSLQSYKNKINLEFLTGSLETLIGLAHSNQRTADSFVEKLSTIYRSILNDTKTELVPLEHAIKNAKNLIEILNYQYDGNLKLNIEFKEENHRVLIVPGTIVVLLEKVVRETIINKYQPLTIECFTNDARLFLRYKTNNRLNPAKDLDTEFESIQKAYAYFSDEQIQFSLKEEFTHIEIPLFKS